LYIKRDIDPTILVKDNITRRHQVLLEEQKNKPFYKGSMNIRFIAMLILIGSYFLVEIIFGAMTESLTMIADAMHMLTDFIALLIGFYSALMANKKRTNKATFGMARMEVIGGLANGCFLMAIALNIFLEAVTKLIKKELNETLISNSLNLMIVGGVGLLINLIGMLIFGSHGHGHSHGHKENDGDFHSRKTKNFNMHAVFLHVMGDTLGSVAVIVSSLVIRYTNWPNRTIIDPICSLVISVIIFLTSIPVVKGATSILLEKVPANIDLNTLKQQLVAIKGVLEIHELHVWQLDSTRFLATCHVILKKEKSFPKISQDLQEVFHAAGVHSTTLQPEYHHHLLGKDKKGNRCFDMVCELKECVEKTCCVDGVDESVKGDKEGNKEV